MKTIKNSKDITTLEVGDVVVFGNLKYVINESYYDGSIHYYLYYTKGYNGIIFEKLNLKKRDFIEKLGINANCACDFPETKSLEALTAIVSALFKEYEKQNELPKTWKEFCKKTPLKMGECLMSSYSDIHITEAVGNSRDAVEDRNYYVSKQEAEAFLALMQLRQLRKAYVKDWEPDWDCTYDNYCIVVCQQQLVIRARGVISRILSFPTYELAEQFLTNFKDLLEIAKPLL